MVLAIARREVQHDGIDLLTGLPGNASGIGRARARASSPPMRRARLDRGLLWGCLSRLHRERVALDTLRAVCVVRDLSDDLFSGLRWMRRSAPRDQRRG